MGSTNTPNLGIFSETLEVYHIVAIGTYHYHPIIHQNPRTRSQQSQWYDRSQVIHDNARPPAATVPVTIIQNPAATRSIFQVETDMTPLVQSPSANVPLCTSSFYTFFYNLPDNTLPIEVIRQAVESGKLSITCTVSYDTHKKIGKGQWSLSTNKKLYTGSTPVLEESKQ